MAIRWQIGPVFASVAMALGESGRPPPTGSKQHLRLVRLIRLLGLDVTSLAHRGPTAPLDAALRTQLPAKKIVDEELSGRGS